MTGSRGTDGVLDPLLDIADALISRPFDVDDVEGFGSLPFLAVSRYSPLNILGSENPHSPASKGGLWCDAFQDLMLATQGKPMSQQRTWSSAFREALGDHNRFMMTGHQFIQHLQRERLSDVFWLEPEQLQAPASVPASHRIGPSRVALPRQEELPREEKTDNSPSTEQEMYNEFLSSINGSGLIKAGIESSRGLIDYIERKAMEANPNLQLESRNRPRPEDHVDSKRPQESAELEKEPEKGVLSTMTTTEKTILPDGTVHSRVVLKKRFADGTIKVTESFDEQPGKLKENKEQTKEEKKEDRKKPGWFWNT